MICLDNTDTIEAWSGTDAVVDYTIHGLVGTTFTQLAAGVLGNVADVVIYPAAAPTSIVSIIFVNTDASAATVNCRLDPADGGNPRYLIPKAVSLGARYSLHTDGARFNVAKPDGTVIYSYPDPLGPTAGGTGLATYTKGDILYASAADVLGALGIGSANYKLFANPAADLPEWSAGINIGTFTRDTALDPGTQAVAGVTFKPSHVIFLAQGINTTKTSIGFDDGTSAYNIHNAGHTVAGIWNYGSAKSIQLVETGPKVSYAYVTTLGADGFTLTWSKDGAPAGIVTIFYMAFR